MMHGQKNIKLHTDWISFSSMLQNFVQQRKSYILFPIFSPPVLYWLSPSLPTETRHWISELHGRLPFEFCWRKNGTVSRI